MTNRSARSIMRSTDSCLLPETSLAAVSEHLSKHHLPGAPVIDERGNAIGYCSEYDCLQTLLNSDVGEIDAATAQSMMTTNVFSIRPDTSLEQLASEMNKHGLNVISVMEKGRLIGVISRGDVMRAMLEAR